MSEPVSYAPWMSSKERIPTLIFTDNQSISTVIANQIANLIDECHQQNRPCVLGLATGSTYRHVYTELVRRHREQGLTFRHVITFNLDEYLGMDRSSLQSYHRFMHEYLFDHIDILPENIHIPDGTVSSSGREQVLEHCRDYEAKIRQAGGIDIQLLGLGREGHIGFNERGSSVASKTRIVTLGRTTRIDAAPDFFGGDSVPTHAITMGISTILSAKKIILTAFGEGKALAAFNAIEGVESSECPASFLQRHENVTVYLDGAAAARLTRVRCPWVLQSSQEESEIGTSNMPSCLSSIITINGCNWKEDDRLVTRAVVWLSNKVNKPVLKLTAADYEENHFQSLLDSFFGADAATLKENKPSLSYSSRISSVEEFNEMVFQSLSSKITRQPCRNYHGSFNFHQHSSGVSEKTNLHVGMHQGGVAIKGGSSRQPSHLSSSPSSTLHSHLGLQHSPPNSVKNSGGQPKKKEIVDSSSADTLNKHHHTPTNDKFTVLVFSPHPDDDVISMGATLRLLASQSLTQSHLGEEMKIDVHVAYQTNGAIAVRDEDVKVYTDFVSFFVESVDTKEESSSSVSASLKEIRRAVDSRIPGSVDAIQVQKAKALIRKCEAISAARLCGVSEANCHFLDMPFYQTGQVVKAPLSEEDISIVCELLDELRPHVIFAAGDLSDPHGTHRVCLQAIFQAITKIREQQQQTKDEPSLVHKESSSTSWWTENNTEVLLYRGAWQEWELWDIDVAVPFSPAELDRKMQAIWRHQSQKDRPLFPGSDPDREFWERARDRNKATADLFASLGVAQHEAMEAFVRWKGNTVDNNAGIIPWF